VPIKAVLERIFLHNMDDYIVKDYKMVEVNKFYDLFWKGIKLFYKEKFDGFVEKMRNTMKFLIDGFTEIIVKTKNQMLTKFDDQMKEIKRSLDDAARVINNFNQFNVDQVVKDVLGFAAVGKTDSMCSYLREAFQGKYKDSLCNLPVKLYKDSMLMKKEI
jgi:adenosine deaminase